ncbi:MAG: hypothetical protein AAGI37_17390 [Planctomycetota bacterium]
MSDVASFSAISQTQVQNEVAFAVARKSLAAARAQGDAAIALLQSAAEVQQTGQQQASTGQARPLGPGQTINVVA